MMIRDWCKLALGLVALAAPCMRAAAQPGSRPFLQATLGGGTSTGGDYEEREAFTLDAMFARRLRPTSPLLGGAALGNTFVNGSDLTCRVAAGGGCVPVMPRYHYAALLVGVEVAGPYGTADVFAGPSVALSKATSHVGAQLRADLVSPSVLHFAVVLSPRLLVIPNVERSTLVLRSVSFGVRIR